MKLKQHLIYRNFSKKYIRMDVNLSLPLAYPLLCPYRVIILLTHTSFCYERIVREKVGIVSNKYYRLNLFDEEILYTKFGLSVMMPSTLSTFSFSMRWRSLAPQTKRDSPIFSAADLKRE